MLIEKENQHDQEMIELKRLLNTEMRRVKDLQAIVEQQMIPLACGGAGSTLTRAKDREISLEDTKSNNNSRNRYA